MGIYMCAEVSEENLNTGAHEEARINRKDAWFFYNAG